MEVVERQCWALVAEEARHLLALAAAGGLIDLAWAAVVESKMWVVMAVEQVLRLQAAEEQDETRSVVVEEVPYEL